MTFLAAGVSSLPPTIIQVIIDEALPNGDRLKLLHVTPAAVGAVCTDAQVSEFAAALPEGFATLVGERGAQLSGGQRQRLGIARALLYEPQVLILAEATAALDVDSERRVIAGIRRRFAGRTLVVIAHRLSTVMGADRIIVLQGGRVAEQGTHEELMAVGGIYRSLYQSEDRIA